MRFGVNQARTGPWVGFDSAQRQCGGCGCCGGGGGQALWPAMSWAARTGRRRLGSIH